MKRALTFALALAVAGSLGAAAPSAAEEEKKPRLSFPMKAGPAVAERAAPVDARIGTLTQRGGSATGARRLTSASVRQDLVRDRVSGTFVLAAEPGAATSSYLRVNFGHLDGSNCQGAVEFHTLTTGTPSAGFTKSGRTFTLNQAEAQAGWENWDCAFAALTDDLLSPPTATYSILGGPLSNVYAQPVLRIQPPELLRSKKIKLVRGVWTTLEVDVKNVGRADAAPVLVTGKGKGLKVKKARGRFPLYDGSTDTVRLRVQLVKNKRKTKLKLTARASGATARNSTAVRKVSPPARPKPGRYASKNGVNFRITAGRKPKVTGFRVYSQTYCGAYPDIPTVTMNYYDFPKSTIGMNGIVDGLDRGELYTARLQLLVKGGKVTRGYFRYGGPNWCRSTKTFTAKRVGR
jgi:hypothetical protein